MRVEPIAQSEQTSEIEYPQSTFLQFIGVLFLLWVLYRIIFIQVPIFIEEFVVKAIFFGLPVWLHVTFVRSNVVHDALRREKMLQGVSLGLLFGGVLGFVSTAAIWMNQTDATLANQFFSSRFWWEFILGIATGFWESLFFFGWIYSMIMIYFRGKWPMLLQLVVTAAIFALFHIPNLFYQVKYAVLAPEVFIPAQILVFFTFALGQALLYRRFRNLYMNAVVHAIWGTIFAVFG